MPTKKEKLINKFVKKDYNDELETILEEKKYSENEKNILLNILYKIENSYKDYESVKRNVQTKEDFLIKIINIIKKDCDKITLVKPSQKKSEILGNKTFIINRENKEIICYPIERKILYSILKISTKPTIINEKYFIINETLSNLVNLGYCIDNIEVIRDFNGFSWTTIKSEIESIEYNLIYQNLNFLLGNKFLNKWVKNKEFLIDYYELLKIKLAEKYGEKITDEIIKIISNLSILLQRRYDRGFSRRMKKLYEENLLKIEETQDMHKFIEKITQQKKELLMDTLINERGKKLEEFERLNNLLNPRNFIQYKKQLIENQKKLELIYCKNFGKEIDLLLIELQNIILDCFKIKINNAKTKNDIVKLFHELRYYGKLPFDRNNNINKVSHLKEQLQEVQEVLIKKAYKLKVINSCTNLEELNIEIMQNIFNTRVINLTDLWLELKKDEKKLYIEIYDEEMLDQKKEIILKNIKSNKKVDTKLNKKIKILFLYGDWVQSPII